MRGLSSPPGPPEQPRPMPPGGVLPMYRLKQIASIYKA